MIKYLSLYTNKFTQSNMYGLTIMEHSLTKTCIKRSKSKLEMRWLERAVLSSSRRIFKTVQQTTTMYWSGSIDKTTLNMVVISKLQTNSTWEYPKFTTLQMTLQTNRKAAKYFLIKINYYKASRKELKKTVERSLGMDFWLSLQMIRNSLLK